MIADYLHSFYTMPINIVIGGVPTRTTIRWFKAPAGAKFLPATWAIFSHVWDNDPGESVAGEIGEVGAPRVWDPGRNPGYQGQCFRGDSSWFQTGQLPPLNTIRPSACLCQIPSGIGQGGLVLGGAALPLPATFSCAQCPGGAPVTWALSFTQGTGDFFQFGNGVRVTLTHGCRWEFHRGSSNWILTFDLSLGWVFTVNQTGSAIFATYVPVGSFNCLGPGVWVLQSSNGTGARPSNVTSAIG